MNSIIIKCINSRTVSWDERKEYCSQIHNITENLIVSNETVQRSRKR